MWLMSVCRAPPSKPFHALCNWEGEMPNLCGSTGGVFSADASKEAQKPSCNRQKPTVLLIEYIILTSGTLKPFQTNSGQGFLRAPQRDRIMIKIKHGCDPQYS